MGAEIKYQLRVERTLNLESSRRLKKELLQVLDRGANHLELDFSETEAIDSSGLGKLLLFNELLKEKGGNFRVVNVNHPELVQLFRLINLEKFMVVEFKTH